MTARTRRTLVAAIESLETRQFMDASGSLVDGVLNVTGTGAKDVIVFSLDRDDPNMLVVKQNRTSMRFDLAAINKVQVLALGGNDRVVVNERNGRITLPFEVDGGAGNDQIVTGSGDDIILAGDGNDRVVGGAGDDQIDGGIGNDSVVGGEDNDTVFGSDGKDKLDGGKGDDNLDGGGGKDALKTGGGDDAVAIDYSNPGELKRSRVDPRTYRVTSIQQLTFDIAAMHESVVPGSMVTRVEEDQGILTIYYRFAGDPKMYKTVVDGNGGEVSLVNRELSPNEWRSPALQQFQARHPGARVASILQHSGGRFDVRYRDSDGELHEVETEDLVWGLDDADEDANEDGIFDNWGVPFPNDGEDFNGDGGPNGGEGDGGFINPPPEG